MKSIAIFAILALILLFGSKSATEPKLVLLAQMTVDDFINHRAQAVISNCERNDAPVVESIQVQIPDKSFAVRELTLYDESSISETVLLRKDQNELWYELESPSCVSRITMLGHRVGASQAKRSVVKLWAYRQ